MGMTSDDGQSARCTERPPVRARHSTLREHRQQRCSHTRQCSSTVYRVLEASGLTVSPAQKRSRERRTYQLVGASQNHRTSSVARNIRYRLEPS